MDWIQSGRKVNNYVITKDIWGDVCAESRSYTQSKSDQSDSARNGMRKMRAERSVSTDNRTCFANLLH